MNKKIDMNENAIHLEAGGEVIDKVRTGEAKFIALDINEDNQNILLLNIGGNLILVTDDTPTTFHGCYFYNDGKFPYAIKDTLEYLVLTDGEKECVARIIGKETEPGVRFNYQGEGKPIEENPDGDSCVWRVVFEVVSVPEDAKTYLLRWNPAISSFEEEDYKYCVANMKGGMFRMNWSIYEWEEARRGDYFYMMRVGDDKAGIVFAGQFLSDPYPGDDWAGSTKRRMYVDIVCVNPVKPETQPSLSLEKLQQTIPTYEWAKGHSGALLTNVVVTELDAGWEI